MRFLAISALVPLLAATRAAAQVTPVTNSPPHVDVIPSDAWLCRQTARDLDESTLLGQAILARYDLSPTHDLLERTQLRRDKQRLGEAIAAFAVEGNGGVIYVGDSTDGGTLLHEATHAMMLRLTPDEARSEMSRVMAASAIAASPIARCFRHPMARGCGPGVLAGRRRRRAGPAARRPTRRSRGPCRAHRDADRPGGRTDLLQEFDTAAVQLQGNVSKGWGRATIADAYDDAATAHWRYAGVPRPDWWSWREERTFRLIGEAVAYERAKRCVAGN